MSWYFLRPGQQAENALASIDSLLASLSSSPNSYPIFAADDYLRWVESAEVQLQSLFDEPARWRSLHTERYWRIRAITEDTVRPAPMLAGETNDQALSLSAIRAQLHQYRVMLATELDERLMVLDTNVLVHGLPFEQVRWNELVTEKKVRVVLPLIVVDELDNLKNQGKRHAGDVLRTLDRLLEPGRALSPLRLRDNVMLQVVNEPLGHTRLTNADDEIVHQAGYYASLAGGRVTIITMDRGMRVRAEAAGINALMLPASLNRSRTQE